MIEIKMPAAGQTTDEAKIVSVNVKVGDTVKRGDILVEAETDKAILPVESFASGKVLSVLVSEESQVREGTILVVLGKEGEVYDPAPPANVPTKATVTEEKMSTVSSNLKTAVVSSSLPAMPNAKKEARDRGLNLADISAANGTFIKKSDVLHYANSERTLVSEMIYYLSKA